MTEQQWQASEDPTAMLDYLDYGGGDPFATDRGPKVEHYPGDRKLRLFAVACGRVLAQDPMNFAGLDRRVVADLLAAVEDFADGRRDELPPHPLGYAGCYVVNPSAHEAVRHAAILRHPKFAAILREIVGNPLAAVTLPQHESPCPDCPDGVPDEHCDDCGGAGVLRSACPWLTADVRNLATAAYEQRQRPCERCLGHPDPTWRNQDTCTACDHTGVVLDGNLDPVRLAVLADALEEAGCYSAECQECEVTIPSKSGHSTIRITGVTTTLDGQTKKTYLPGCRRCDGSGNFPHPLLTHLRSPVPHVRGCWALDLLLGWA